MKTLRWTKVSNLVQVTETFTVVYESGHKVLVNFRIDARNASKEGIRVDRGGIMGWEAIDGGKGLHTKKAAKELATRYLQAIQEQETLTPRFTV